MLYRKIYITTAFYLQRCLRKSCTNESSFHKLRYCENFPSAPLGAYNRLSQTASVNVSVQFGGLLWLRGCRLSLSLEKMAIRGFAEGRHHIFEADALLLCREALLYFSFVAIPPRRCLSFLFMSRTFLTFS